MAFSTIMMNKVTQKLKKDMTSRKVSTEVKTVDGMGFSLRTAKLGEEKIYLPSNKCFKMSDLLTPTQASKLTSTDFGDHCKSLYRTSFKKLASYDYFFPVYCATEFSTLGYAPFGDDFYGKVSKYTCDGFGQQFDEDTETVCTCAARDVLINLIDRIRKELKAEVVQQRKKEFAKLTQGREDAILIDFNAPPTELLRCLQ